MAARRPRKRSDQKKPQKKPELDRTSLRGAAQYALARLAVLEDGADKAAALLKARLDARAGVFADVTVEQIELWFTKGISPELLADPVKVAMIFTDVSALTRRHELGGKEGLDETAQARKAKHKKLAFTGLLEPSELEPDEDPAMAKKVSLRDRKNAKKRLEAIGKKIAQKEAELGEKRSVAAVMAEQLGVKPSTVRRWLESGQVSEAGTYKFLQYELGEKGDREVERQERKIFEELLKAGRKPHTIRKEGERYWDAKQARWVKVMKTEEAPVVPKFRGGEGYYGGDGTSGYRWNTPIRDYLTPTLLRQMMRMALTVPTEGLRRRIKRKMPEWAVFVVVSVLYAVDGQRGHPVRSAAGHLYGKNVRSDLEPQFPKHANRFIVKDAYSSGNQDSLPSAVAAFEKRMWPEIKSGDRVYVHGLVVWNFRRRTTSEQADIVEQRRLQAKQKRAKKKRIAKEKFKRQLGKEGRAARAAVVKRKKDES